MTEREYITAIKDAAKAHLDYLEEDGGLYIRRRLNDLMSTISPVTLAAMCEAWLGEEWRPKEEAPEELGARILALSSSQSSTPPHHVERPAYVILKLFKYNGLLAWRDWDGDYHDFKYWRPLPNPPKEGDANV